MTTESWNEVLSLMRNQQVSVPSGLSQEEGYRQLREQSALAQIQQADATTDFIIATVLNADARESK